MKKTLSFLICILILVSCCLPAAAAHVSGPEAITALSTLGLLRGTGNGFSPERNATRGEAVVMLLRLLGREAEAEQAALASPFPDGGWADSYLGYAAQAGLVRGREDGSFGTAEAVSARDYVTMTLRALGYAEGSDFTWADSLELAERVGLTHGEYTADQSAPFLREDLALVSYTALTLPAKGTDRRLIEALYTAGVVSADALRSTRFADVINAGRQELDAMTVHERSASAVLYVDLYATEKDMAENNPDGNGSAFLISPDGVAVMCWHELSDKFGAIATATDGRRFPVQRVLYYNVLADAAVVRLDRTALDGETVRFFPYLELGDSTALRTGETVYTVSNPLGLIDTVSSGLVSHPFRNVDDPEYLYIQITAPISNGSSGGPLLNRFGEVVGILFGSFVRGQNMNLAVPINRVRGVDLSAEGMTVAEAAALEKEKKDAAVITVSVRELTLTEGGRATVLVESDYPGTVNFRYDVGDTSVASCAWEDYETKQSVPLRITANKAGTTEVTITFADDGNPEAEAKIQVTVTGKDT